MIGIKIDLEMNSFLYEIRGQRTIMGNLMIAKIYCWLFKHDTVATGEHENHHSKFGDYLCLRCGKILSWQYDY